ncbi:protein-disulfide isomerase [Cohnella lupini]|uniref:Protein-disulfide isomerase n=1 Tax=Cohnella lupini TaxID=1294267 RepID=A0A3D9IBV4_9BACL|nr:protein-disulfide isomerase [Cohnella lupini]
MSSRNRNHNRGKKSKTLKKKNPAKVLVLYTFALIVLLLAIFLINRATTGSEQDMTRVEELPSIVNQPVIGQESAKVTMVEFGDYKCPSCKQWSEVVYPQLKAEYIDTGKMKLVFINTLFHGAESELGAIAGEAVFSQNKDLFWDFNKAMFANQPTADHDVNWITVDKVLEVAQSVSPTIDLTKLKDDIVNKTTEPSVNIDTELVAKYRINQTPTLIINGIVIHNPFDIESIKSVIDKEIGA